MATTQKAQDIARDLLDSFAKQVAADLPVQVLSADSANNPVITLSADATPATGEKVIVLVIKPYATGVAKDVFGNTALNYSPHIIQICTEKNYEATTDNVLDILGPAQLLPVLAEVVRRGTVVEWHRSNNGTVPSTTVIEAGTGLAATYKPLYWGVQSAL